MIKDDIINKLPSHNKCTGCGCCYNVCVNDAIEMIEDEEGFLVPHILDNCICCNKCVKSCPVLTDTHLNSEEPDIYAVAASDEIRSNSSSGGFFTLISKFIFDNHGTVFGAVFDKNFKVHHTSARNIKELEKMRSSKYLQSNIGKTYIKVKEELEHDRYVLFTGTPCQISALYNFLGKDYEKLWTADVICHGVPSQLTFDKYLSECHGTRKIKTINFRDKRNGWRADVITIDFKDGNTYSESEDPYEYGFQKNIFLRKCCSPCKFCEFPRRGDFSMGDFWGIHKISPKLNDRMGLSMVFANNNRSKSLVRTICENTNVIQKMNDKVDRKKIPNRLKKDYPAHIHRDRYFDLIKKTGFSDAVYMTWEKRFDIGLVGIYSVGNFGGAMTNYGLYSALIDAGYSVMLIERPLSCKHKPFATRVFEKNPYPEYSMARKYVSKEGMRELNGFIKTFLVGSDQMFNNDLYYRFGEWVTLDWVNDNKKKIAYAASYGHDLFWGSDETRSKMSYFMKKFDAFSVRERSGVELSRKEFGVDATWVLDPVFLCDASKYSELISSNKEKNEPHIAAYILDPDAEKIKILQYVSEKKKLPVEIYSEVFPDNEFFESHNITLKDGFFEDRLRSIRDSDFVVTDSYHGMCFAIIFNKPFVVIKNKKRGAARFESIVDLLGIRNRMVESLDDLNGENMTDTVLDYSTINEILDGERRRCLDWLRSQIDNPIKKSYSDYDMMNIKLEEYDRKLIVLKTENKRLLDKIDSLSIRGENFLLSDIENIEVYFDVLSKQIAGRIILISIKDTPGAYLTNKMMDSISKIGIKTNLVNRVWNSYVAVIDNGDCVFEKIGANEEPIVYTGYLSGKNVKIESRGFRCGNKSSIILDGKEYSVNKRGLNIVVFDCNKDSIVDSIAFDTHDVLISASR